MLWGIRILQWRWHGGTMGSPAASALPGLRIETEHGLWSMQSSPPGLSSVIQLLENMQIGYAKLPLGLNVGVHGTMNEWIIGHDIHSIRFCLD